MILENDFSVAAPMERVYDALTDSAVVVSSLPGARRSARSEDVNAASGELRITLGSTLIPYRGTVRLDEGDREAGALALTIDAREGRGRGVLHASVSIRLRESHGATTVSLRSEVDVEGRAAKVASSDIQGAVQSLLAEFGQNIQTRMNGGTPAQRDAEDAGEATTAEPASVAETAGAPALSVEPVAVGSPPPPPAAEGNAPDQPRVRGTVRIMTTEPISSDTVPQSDGAFGMVRDQLRSRPWLAPLVLLVCLGLLLVARRRRRD
jgi:carbon monoxide dehydrogenase subunit G